MAVSYPSSVTAYYLLEQLGRGPHSSVQKARVKLIEPSSCTSEVLAIKSITGGDFEKIQSELQKISTCTNPKILRVCCWFPVAEDCLWIVSPYASGGSLHDILLYRFPNGLSEDYLKVILKEVLIGIEGLHRENLVHGSVKSSNVLIDIDNGSVWLSDLGVSEAVRESTEGWNLKLLQSQYWIPPETISSRVWANKGDVWSFGVLALELAYGFGYHFPFLAMGRSITRDWDWNQGRTFSEDFKMMVKSCISRDPLERPSTADLLNHGFFDNCGGLELLKESVLKGLPMVEQIFKERNQPIIGSSMGSMGNYSDSDYYESSISSIDKEEEGSVFVTQMLSGFVGVEVLERSTNLELQDIIGELNSISFRIQREVAELKVEVANLRKNRGLNTIQKQVEFIKRERKERSRLTKDLQFLKESISSSFSDVST